MASSIPSLDYQWFAPRLSRQTGGEVLTELKLAIDNMSETSLFYSQINIEEDKI